ncbi:glycoside hydrolase domain-containing protein [Paraliobacillus zengyii]|uniref:glycoside hydrolase domain-containing protein n=1 Tax=Paraliobacillus zengyii TaxID=2213194 RepID=UPI000DD31DF8|nr:glycoside hydrolase domain-containing protein [Paraliobacillus zengyii]
MSYLWGVDSTTNVTKDLYNSVLKKYRKPEYWGRYITSVEGVTEGLTQTEVELLHNSGTKILPIYSKFATAIGSREGRTMAQNAVFHARRLGIPEGTIIFANIENLLEVDKDWVVGYVEAMYPTGYKPGFYNDPNQGDFSSAYCQAVSENDQIAVQAVLWSAEPDTGISKQRKAPKFEPSTPNCTANIWAWQYGRDAPTYAINTNLINRRLHNILW